MVFSCFLALASKTAPRGLQDVRRHQKSWIWTLQIRPWVSFPPSLPSLFHVCVCLSAEKMVKWFLPWTLAAAASISTSHCSDKEEHDPQIVWATIQMVFVRIWCFLGHVPNHTTHNTNPNTRNDWLGAETNCGEVISALNSTCFCTLNLEWQCARNYRNGY